MNFETTIQDDHQVKITLQLKKDDFERTKRRSAKKLSRQTKIPGFRPGKAPYNLVVRYVGEDNILGDAIETLVDDLYPKVLEEGEIKPYSPGTLKDFNEDIPSFEFLVPLAPEVELGDYRAVRLPYEPKEIDEEAVRESLNNIRENQVTIEIVDRPAEVGDQLNISLKGNETVEECEEEESFSIDEPDFLAIIEAEDVDPTGERPFPGFSRQLIGLSAGDEKTIDYTFPNDYDIETLQGKSVIYHVEVKNVNLRILPQLNDELAKSIGDFESLDELRDDVRGHLEEISKEQYDADYEDNIMDEIIATTTTKYPPQMLESEIDAVIDQLKNRLSIQGMDMDTYLKIRDMDEAALKEDLASIAERRLVRGLVLMEIASKEGIQVSQADVQADVQNTLATVYSSVPENAARRLLTADAMRGLVSSSMTGALVEQAMERLRAIANGDVEKESTAKEKINGSEDESKETDNVVDDEQGTLSGETESPDDGELDKAI